jgi:hypothetical protein
VGYAQDVGSAVLARLSALPPTFSPAAVDTTLLSDLWVLDSTSTMWSLADFTANGSVANGTVAQYAAIHYRHFGGLASPILARARIDRGSARRLIALQAIRETRKPIEAALVTDWLCQSLWILRASSRDPGFWAPPERSAELGVHEGIVVFAARALPRASRQLLKAEIESYSENLWALVESGLPEHQLDP